MPYLHIQTNIDLSQEATNALMRKSSQSVAELLNKPEQYVMVAIEANTAMLFAASDAPTAFLALKSIGLPESATVKLSQALCEIVNSETGIATNRIYIEFTDAPRKMWGWDNRTF